MVNWVEKGHMTSLHYSDRSRQLCMTFDTVFRPQYGKVAIAVKSKMKPRLKITNYFNLPPESDLNTFEVVGKGSSTDTSEAKETDRP